MGPIDLMSRIWEALQKVEKARDEEVEAVVPVEVGRMRLTPKQQVAVQALLRTSTLEEAAVAAEVTEMTLRRWLGRPGFVAEYYAAGRAEIERSMQRLDRATETAAAVLAQANRLLGGVRERAELASNGAKTEGEPVAANGSAGPTEMNGHRART